MSKRVVLCKFFAHGACLKGEHCEFSHDWKDTPNNVCTFYQKGVCFYGSRCRYDHVKVPRHHNSAPPSSSNSRPHLASDSVQVSSVSGVPFNGEHKPSLNSPELSALSKPFLPPGRPAWTLSYETHSNDVSGYHPSSTSLVERPICSFAAAGNCPHGERCPHIHGNLCSICGKHCLHPYRPDEREEHIKLCEKNNKRLEDLRRSQEIECSVCLDRVLSKPTAAERKFGLLSECDHPFCISCIRNWRSNSPSSGMDVNTALRACPICRKLSYFVIPSVIWYSTKEEKQEIIDSYKAKLKSIDCKYFDFGNGTCPFGTSCFYKHTYKRHTKRAHTYKPRTYRPRQAARQTVIGEELVDFVRETFLEEALEDLTGQIEEEFENSDGENVSNSLEMAFLLMQLACDDWDLLNDDEC